MLLGWIGFLSMMQFIFACHMFTQLHALHVLSSFLCLKVSTMLLFFSLSLLFSLLIMAPKNFIPSKNLIRHGSSSSSFPPDSIWFRDEKAHSD